MKNTERYGREIGAGIKKGMRGLNTMCSPKKRKTCILLILLPLVLVFTSGMIGATTQNDTVSSITAVSILAMGACQFYVGRFKRGLFYTFTLGGFLVCILSDLFKLVVTKTFKDANGFPVIY